MSGFAVHLVAAQLAAGGADLAAQTAADRGVDAEALQLLLEPADVGGIGGGVGAAVHRVDGDEVDMCAHAPDEVCQLLCAGIGIVDAAHHRILEADPSARGVLIAADRLHQLLHGVGIVHGHHAAADLIVGRMERDGKGELQLFLGQLVDLRHQTAGGKADVPHPDVDAFGRGDILKESHHFVEIVQRLADAHEHDVGDALPDVLLRGVDLGADLTGFQVADAARLSGRAEAAAHPATHLRGDADRVAVVVAHDDRFDAVAVGHPQQVFDRAVLGLLAALDLRGRDVEMFLQRCQQGLGLVGHGGKLRDQLLVDPVEDLLGPETGLAQRLELCGQLFQRQGGNAAFLFHGVLLLIRFRRPPHCAFCIAQRKKPSIPVRVGTERAPCSPTVIPAGNGTSDVTTENSGWRARKAATCSSFSAGSMVQVE